jgi:hypothetical protein
VGSMSVFSGSKGALVASLIVIGASVATYVSARHLTVSHLEHRADEVTSNKGVQSFSDHGSDLRTEQLAGGKKKMIKKFVISGGPCSGKVSSWI